MAKTDIGKRFENEIKYSFSAYEATGIAMLRMLPVPTAPAPKKYRNPQLRVLCGNSPFDVGGWTFDGARYIGAELKATAKYKPSLPIVPAGRDGSGIQEHQLKALADLSSCGGLAFVVWNNGGEVGVIDLRQIVATWAVFLASKHMEEAGKTVLRGSRSIKWGVFQPVKDRTTTGGKQFLHWLQIDALGEDE